MDTKTIVFLIVLTGLIFIYIRFRKTIGLELLIAFFIAFLWTLYFRYEYVGNNVFLFDRINLYPLIIWTAGLVILRRVYKQIPKWNFVYITLIYWLALAVIETFGYYFLNVRLVTDYPSLLGLGIIHIPIVAQTFYLAIGPVYILITNYLEEILHKKKLS